MSGQDFASIHSSPPWDDRDNPTIVDHVVGAGRCIYSVAPIEAAKGAASAILFSALIAELLDHTPTIDVATHPDVWVTAFDQPDKRRVTLSALRYEAEPPAGTVPLTVRYRPMEDRRVVSVRHALSNSSRPYSESADSSVEIRLGELKLFDLWLIDYELIKP
jgi:hypothetical protein